MGRTMVSQQCGHCGKTFTARQDAIKRGQGRFCTHACWAASRSAAPRVSRYRLGHGDHPLRPPRGRVSLHRAVLYDAIGAGPHPCHWCGRILTWRIGRAGADALIVDHLDGDGQNNEPANLVPSCMSCNTNRDRSKGILTGVSLPGTNGRRRRAIERKCEQCSAPFLARAYEVGTSRGRFCSPKCATRHRAA